MIYNNILKTSQILLLYNNIIITANRITHKIVCYFFVLKKDNIMLISLALLFPIWSVFVVSTICVRLDI